MYMYSHFDVARTAADNCSWRTKLQQLTLIRSVVVQQKVLVRLQEWPEKSSMDYYGTASYKHFWGLLLWHCSL